MKSFFGLEEIRKNFPEIFFKRIRENVFTSPGNISGSLGSVIVNANGQVLRSQGPGLPIYKVVDQGYSDPGMPPTRSAVGEDPYFRDGRIRAL